MKQSKTNMLEEAVREVLEESTKIHYGKYDFLLKVDTNEDPQKKGVKVQFIPTVFGQMNATTQNDIAIELESRLEKGLEKYGLRVERDRGLKDKTVIGFFIYIEYFDRLVRKALEGENPSKKAENPEEPLESASLNESLENYSAYPEKDGITVIEHDSTPSEEHSVFVARNGKVEVRTSGNSSWKAVSVPISKEFRFCGKNKEDAAKVVAKWCRSFVSGAGELGDWRNWC